MTITLASIEAEHARISALIEQFKKQPAPTELRIPAVTIPLAAGERLAGAILNNDGSVAHYVILLPGDADEVNWESAKEWAAEQGGELPTRREQSLLFTNLRDEFESAWYWSAEVHGSKSGWAWCQLFGTGNQHNTHQNYEFRARAVRRFIPSVI
ncbi:DUF1566 domain-containing protein [Burkholderia gladioli]|uniref:DUF1566 domain-containing protein n=1 Tax=Burkholderia gladioli TaxID=28095 RepID=UPI001C268B69|nr:DUF1566 domain-containing protein [Burkholderia gladioli]MBU9380690.1 DUF1566 domain-containing protein [Burkholderia gladioli]